MDAIMVKLMVSTQAETLRLYHLSVGGAAKADEGITKLIASANFETLTSLSKQYSAIVEKSFTAECADCHSKNITRASSINPESGVADEGKQSNGGAPATKSTSDAVSEIYNKMTGENKAGIQGKFDKKK